MLRGRRGVELPGQPPAPRDTVHGAVHSARGERCGNFPGRALLLHYRLNPRAERTFVWDHSYWGPRFDDSECLAALNRSGLKHERKDNVARYTAGRIAAGNVVGWFQGRMEVGPRALGNRSLLADPRPGNERATEPSRQKCEEFRPFAPSILEEAANDFFDLHGVLSPYMIMVGDVHPDKKGVIPAVTHVDGTASAYGQQDDEPAATGADR